MLKRQVKDRIEANRNRRTFPNWRKAEMRAVVQQMRETATRLARLPLNGALEPADYRQQLRLLVEHDELLCSRLRQLRSRRTTRIVLETLPEVPGPAPSAQKQQFLEQLAAAGS